MNIPREVLGALTDVEYELRVDANAHYTDNFAGSWKAIWVVPRASL